MPQGSEAHIYFAAGTDLCSPWERLCGIAWEAQADFNYEETLGTLRFAGRARSIRNRPVINEDRRVRGAAPPACHLLSRRLHMA